jgi:hypothetical protein
MVLLLTTETLVAEVPPIVTEAFVWKLLPLIVTDVPPAVEPELGEMLLTVGAGVGAT